MSRHLPWHDRNVAERLVFSSFTTAADDIGGADTKRPYAIVALPGYEVPEALDKLSKDALWLTKSPAAPVIVWDGFSPHALYEVIYECFGFTYDQTAGKISVLDVKSGDFLPDARATAVMKYRPIKPAGLGKTASYNRLLDLYAWSCIFERPGPGNIKHAYLENGGGRTHGIYYDLFQYTWGRPDSHPSSTDSGHRGKTIYPRTGVEPRSAENLMRGPLGSLQQDDHIKLRSSAINTLECIKDHAPPVGALARMTHVPPSLYAASMPSERDPETGLMWNIEEDSRRAYEQTIGATAKKVAPLHDVGDSGHVEDSRSFLSRILSKRNKF
ncbi:hypothetical protein ACOI1H_16670 [Loktanella sp. DJP18]|uniref:hypothetical protein n=1 Tax=Loktanella sp. DJP18 TaxID=3409788 RepID=UPI003BB75789